MKTTTFTFLIALTLTAAVPAIDTAPKQPPPTPAAVPEKQRELLSSHNTVARFEG